MPKSNQTETAISATVPTFADDFSDTIIAYLEQKKGGARDRVNKALKDQSLSPVTRLFNEMVSISPQVLAVEYNNVLQAKDAEDYSMQVVKAAARTILNDDFTDLKPDIAKKFSNLSKLKKLCEKENTTIVDMLLKGISALHAQCLADALTTQVREGSARDRTDEDRIKIEQIVSILPILESVQVVLTRETLLLPSGAEDKIDINPVELRSSLTEALKEIDDSKSVIEESARIKFDLSQDTIEELISNRPQKAAYLKPFEDRDYEERDKLLQTYNSLNNMRQNLETAIEMVDMSQGTEMILKAQDKLDKYRSSLTASDMTSEPDEQKSPEKPQTKAKAFSKSSEKEYQLGVTRLGAMKLAHKNAKDFETKSGIETKYIELYERLNAIEGLPAASKTKLNMQYSPKFDLFEQSFENNTFKFLQKEFNFVPNKDKGNTFARFNAGEGGVLSRMFDDFIGSPEVMQDTLDRVKQWQGDEENHLKDIILKSAQKSGLFNETLTDLSPAAKQFFAGKLDLSKKFGTQQVARELLTSIKGSYIQTLTQQSRIESSTLPVEKRINEQWFPLLVARSNQITQANLFTQRDRYIATIIPSAKEQKEELQQRLSNLEQTLEEEVSSGKVEYVNSNLHKVQMLYAELDVGHPIDIALFNETLLKCGLDRASHEISDAIERLETYKNLLIEYGALNDDDECQQMSEIINTLRTQQSAVKACVSNLPVNDLQKTLDDTAAIFVNVQNALNVSPTKTTTSGILNRLKNAIARVIEFINSCFGLGTKAAIEDLNENKQAIINSMKQMKDELRSMRLETPTRTQSISSELSQTAGEPANKIPLRSIPSSKTTEEDVTSKKPS